MNILAIDTSLPVLSVCLLPRHDGAHVSKVSKPMLRGHAEALMPAIEEVIAASPMDFDAIDRVAVTVGPGSFTGVRVGIAAAKGLGLALKVPVVGVSTLAAFAADFIGTIETGLIASTIDARHGNIYIQAVNQNGQVIISSRVMRLSEAVRVLGSGQVRLIGPGSALVAAEAWATGLRTEIMSEETAPDILSVARIGAIADPEKSPARPMYLRPVDAKTQN